MSPHTHPVSLVARIRAIAKVPGAVWVGGDAVLSMGGRGVDGRAIQYALENVATVDQPGPDVVITGPTPDGEVLRIVARIEDDELHVSNVVL